MEVTAVEVGEPLAGPGVQVARPCVQLVVYCILAHPEELHPLLIDSTCKDEMLIKRASFIIRLALTCASTLVHVCIYPNGQQTFLKYNLRAA